MKRMVFLAAIILLCGGAAYGLQSEDKGGSKADEDKAPAENRLREAQSSGFGVDARSWEAAIARAHRRAVLLASPEAGDKAPLAPSGTENQVAADTRPALTPAEDSKAHSADSDKNVHVKSNKKKCVAVLSAGEIRSVRQGYGAGPLVSPAGASV